MVAGAFRTKNALDLIDQTWSVSFEKNLLLEVGQKRLGDLRFEVFVCSRFFQVCVLSLEGVFFNFLGNLLRLCLLLVKVSIVLRLQYIKIVLHLIV